MKMTPYIISAFAGAVVAIVLALLLVGLAVRHSDTVSLNFGKAVPLYKDILLIETKVQPAGIYVRYRNTGTKTCTGVTFKIKVYKDGALEDEFEEAHYEVVVPGNETEGIVKLRKAGTLESVPLEGRVAKVEFRYGFLE